MSQSVITYRFEPDQNADLEAIRLTVRTVTMAQVGLHARLGREAEEQWRLETNNPTDEQRAAQSAAKSEAQRKAVISSGKEEETGKDAKEEALTPEPKKKPTAEDNVLYNQYMRWPTVYVATADRLLVVKRNNKKAKEMDDEAPDTWPWEQSSKVAMGWDKPEGILNLPWDFFAEWERQAHLVNAGLFSQANGSAGKKKGMGLISVI